MFFDDDPGKIRAGDTGAIGDPATFSERAAAAFDAGIKVNNFMSQEWETEGAYDRRNKAVKDAIGLEMPNPMRAEYLDASGKIARRGWNDRTPNESWHNDYQRTLEALATKHPEHKSVISADRPVRADAAKVARDAEDRSNDAQRSYKGVLGTGFIADMAGGLAAQAFDPVNAATLFIGPIGRVGTGAKEIIAMGLKQGAANAAVEAAMQPAVQNWRKAIGVENGFGEAATNVAMAGAFGFGADAGIRTAYRGLRSRAGHMPVFDDAGKISGYETPAASAQREQARVRAEEIQKALKDLPPDTTEAVRRAQGDLESGQIPRVEDVDAMKRYATATKAIEDPAFAGTLEQLKFTAERKRVEIDGIDDGTTERRMIQAIRSSVDADEPPPVHIPPARKAEGPDLADHADVPGAHTGNQHIRRFDMDGKPVEFRSFKPGDIGTDAPTFQFKGGGDGSGVTGKLANVTRWDEPRSGKIIAFERGDGTVVVADGHQRLNLAQRDGADLQGYLFREADGWTAADVRAQAAKKNIQEGTGNLMDVARAIHERPEIVDDRMPLNTDFMRQARALARLSESAFSQVARGEVSPNTGALVAELVPDAVKHSDVIDLLSRANPADDREARAIIGSAIREPVSADAQAKMLGVQVMPREIIPERMAIMTDVMETLHRNIYEGDAFGSAQSYAIVTVLDRLSMKRGIVSGWLNDAARAVSQGQPQQRATDAFLRRIQEQIDRGGVKSLDGDGPLVLAAMGGQRVEPGARPASPIDPRLSAREKLKRLQALTHQNRPILEALVRDLNKALPDAPSTLTFKDPDATLAKATRPEIKEKKPWFGVEHVNDYARWSTVINEMADIPKALDLLRGRGIEVIKLDTARLFSPLGGDKGFGFREMAADLRMPNGQLVEWAFPVREMEAVAAKADALYAPWRNASKSQIEARRVEYDRDRAASKALYDGAFAGALQRMGFATEQDAKAAFGNIEVDAAQRVADVNSSRPPVVEESFLKPDQIVNPIDPKATPEEKLAQIKALTAENKRALDAQLKQLDNELGTKSNSNIKKDDTILAKASRPSVLAEKPWHGVEHIRDTLRFQTLVDNLEQIEPAITRFLELGYKPIKFDTAKMTNPKGWGWRFAGLDMRAPNGQILEWYIIFKEMYDAKKEGHVIFEKWRGMTAEQMESRRLEYLMDQKKSFDLYKSAFETGLKRSGYASVDAAKADISKLSASLPSIAEKFSAMSSASGGAKFFTSFNQGLPSAGRNQASPLSPMMSTRPDPSSAARTSGLSDIGASNQNIVGNAANRNGQGRDILASLSASDLDAFTKTLNAALDETRTPPTRRIDDVRGKDGQSHIDDLREQLATEIKDATAEPQQMAAVRQEQQLDMSPEARKARAESMGFDTSTVWYHGTNQPLDVIKPGMRDPGAWFTTDMMNANNYARGDEAQLYSVYLRAENPMVVEAADDGAGGFVPMVAGKPLGLTDNVAIVRLAQSLGHDAVHFPDGNFSESGNTMVVFDAKRIRDTDAAFDPAEAASAKLLASASAEQPSLTSIYQRYVTEGRDALDAAIPGASKTVEDFITVNPDVAARIAEALGAPERLPEAQRMIEQAMSPAQATAAPTAPQMAVNPRVQDFSKPQVYSPEYNARRAEIMREIDRTVQMLPPDVRIQVEDQLVFNFGDGDRRLDGLWDGYDRLVYVALQGGDPVRAARHEVVHALRQSGLMTDDEFGMLYKFAEGLDLRKAYNIDAMYRQAYNEKYGHRGGDFVEQLLREETIANMFSDYSLNGRRFGDVAGGSLVDRFIDRIVSFMKDLRDMLGGYKFKDVNDIFQSIESGEMAWRAPDFDALDSMASLRQPEDRMSFRENLADAAREGHLRDVVEACKA